jgi:KaiC/GvpD/RAD55 family RecA-like ATPase
VIIIDVKEPKETVVKWARKHGFDFPVLLDDGSIAARYALPGILPDLPREDTVIAANLLIDGAGNIRFYSLLDTASFDARLIALTNRLEEVLKER